VVQPVVVWACLPVEVQQVAASLAPAAAGETFPAGGTALDPVAEGVVPEPAVARVVVAPAVGKAVETAAGLAVGHRAAVVLMDRAAVRASAVALLPVAFAAVPAEVGKDRVVPAVAVLRKEVAVELPETEAAYPAVGAYPVVKVHPVVAGEMPVVYESANFAYPVPTGTAHHLP